MKSSEFVSSYFDAWNQCDAAGVAEHLAQSGTYIDTQEQAQLNRDDLIAHLKDFFAQKNNLYQLLGDVLTGENSIAFQYRAIPLEPGSDDAEWTGAEFITMAGDAAIRIEDYYQSPGLSAARRSVRVASGRRYAKSGLDAQSLSTMMARINNLMEAKRVFLEPDLSLPHLAERLDCSVNHLSQAINAGFGVSFFDFINQYRIREAVSILSGATGSAPPILEVALAVGFNSTSTFYAAFKKITGQTPAQYRRAIGS
jgi:AraC-like DNA-binding protein